MALRAADLTPEQKRALLDHMRTSMVGVDVDQALHQWGEDSLIDAFLQTAQQSNATRQSSRGWIADSVAWLCDNGFIFIGLGWPGFVIWAACWLVFFALWLIGRPEQAGVAFAGVIGVAILAGVGYGLWLLGPWMLTGVTNWFGWLASRF